MKDVRRLTKGQIISSLRPSIFWNFGLSTLPTCGLQLRIQHPLSKSNCVSLCRPSLLLPVEIHHFFLTDAVRAEFAEVERSRFKQHFPFSLAAFVHDFHGPCSCSCPLDCPPPRSLLCSPPLSSSPHLFVYRYGGRLHRHLTSYLLHRSSRAICPCIGL